MLNILEKAFQFALDKHDGQYRKGTSIPYITHPYAVGMILKHHGYSDHVVAAGLLHDTLEDTNTSPEEIFQQFGSEVLSLVQAASEQDKTLSWEERKSRTIQALPKKSEAQLAVILADKLHNIRSIGNDLNEIGEAVWNKFNSGKHSQAWYYRGILNEIAPRQQEMPLFHLLEAEVKQVFNGFA